MGLVNYFRHVGVFESPGTHPCDVFEITQALVPIPLHRCVQRNTRRALFVWVTACGRAGYRAYWQTLSIPCILQAVSASFLLNLFG